MPNNPEINVVAKPIGAAAGPRKAPATPIVSAADLMTDMPLESAESAMIFSF